MTQDLFWCGFCFRRNSWENSQYCVHHRPEADAESDTEYRRGRRLRATLPRTSVAIFTGYQEARIRLGETPNLQSQNAWPLPTTLSKRRRGVVAATLNLAWSTTQQEWEDILAQDFPVVASIVTKRPAQFVSHSEFAESLLGEIFDREESNTHPLWVIWILACAEAWYRHENANWDRRGNQTSAEVEKLWMDGIHNGAEISRRLGISKQRVAQILKDLGLR
jgi:hypothetical protein